MKILFIYIFILYDSYDWLYLSKSGTTTTGSFFPQWSQSRSVSNALILLFISADRQVQTDKCILSLSNWTNQIYSGDPLNL